VFSHLKKLILGSGLAQGIQFASLLVLSRIYTPSDFGVLSQIQSIASAAAVVFTLQLHLAIPQSIDQQEAKDTARNIQLICLTFCAILGPIGFIFGNIYGLSAVFALFLSLNNTFISYLVFAGDFASISRFYLIRALLIVILQIGFSQVFGSYGLVAGVMAAEFVAALYLIRKSFGSITAPKLDFSGALSLLVRLRSFSLYGTTQELISVLAFYAPFFMFVHFYGDETGGQYSMASRLVWAPVVLLSGSISQVLQHQLGKEGQKNLWGMRGSFFRFRYVLAAAVVCVIPFLIEDQLTQLLGSNWRLASQMIPLHLIWGFIFLLSIPFRVACRVLHVQLYQMVIDAGILVAICVTFFTMSSSPIHAMWALVVIGLIQNALLSAAVWLKMKRTAAEAAPATPPRAA